MRRMVMLASALAAAACSSGSRGGPPIGDAGSSGPDGGAQDGSTSPCGPGGVYGTFTIQGTLAGTEMLCGLSLGSFDGGTLTIAPGSGSGATVTVTGSGAGHIDVSGCAATVAGCDVSAQGCAGSTGTRSTVSLDLTVDPNLTGTSQLGFNGCQAPGLSFTGTR